jgi:hypothetical protein
MSCRFGHSRGKNMQVRSISAANNVYRAPAKTYSVAQAVAALKLNSKLKITLRDTPANITNNLNALKKIQTQITQITLPNANDKLNMNGAQLKEFDKLLAKVPDNTLVLTDKFSALNTNISIMRENNAKINKIILTPSTDATAKQTISPWDSQLWSKSVNGKFEIQTQVTTSVSGTATTPSSTNTNNQNLTVQPTNTIAKFSTFEDTQALAANYMGLKALDDMGMLTGIEAFKGSSITTTIAQGKALSALFNKYSTEFYLNIRDTTTNISKNIDFISSSNKKLTGITQIGNIKPLEITRNQNRQADLALSKMKNPYSIKYVG